MINATEARIAYDMNSSSTKCILELCERSINNAKYKSNWCVVWQPLTIGVKLSLMKLGYIMRDISNEYDGSGFEIHW